MKDFHEQKITRTLALTQLFLKKIGAGVCRVHGGGFAGVIAAIIPEKEQENYVEYISKFVGKENVYPMGHPCSRSSTYRISNYCLLKKNIKSQNKPWIIPEVYFSSIS